MPVLAPPGSVVSGELASFEGAGGRPLRYRVLRAPEERHALVYVHGIESHGGWFLPAAQLLSEHGTTTYLVDRRGSGLNRDVEPGDARSAATLLEDLRRFRSHAGLAQPFLAGLSWGGKLALAAALDQPVRGVVLVTPGLVPRVDLSAPQKLRLLLALAVGGRARFHVPITPEMFTHTPRYLEYIRNDPDRLERVSARFLFASWTLDRSLRARIHVLRAPVLLLLAARDRIVDNERTWALCAKLPDGMLRASVYQQAEHSIQFDHTTELVRDVSSFLEEVAC